MNMDSLNKVLDERHLLKHDFYKMWSAGELNLDVLSKYAQQYYHHVDAFPRYISSIHYKCENIEHRQILLGNLIDEEQGEKNHPELWVRFAEGVGAKRDVVKSKNELNDKTKALVNGFFDLCAKSYASGLGALYTYERQVPEIAQSKIDGLVKFYNIADERSLEFFKVHIHADEWHSQEVYDLIDALPKTQKKEAFEAAEQASKLLWGFLDGMMEQCNLQCSH